MPFIITAIGIAIFLAIALTVVLINANREYTVEINGDSAKLINQSARIVWNLQLVAEWNCRKANGIMPKRV